MDEDSTVDRRPAEVEEDAPAPAAAPRGRGRLRCRGTATSTASCRGSRSTGGCSTSPRTRRLPVLERANFLAIFASNLDEFFMVRVAGLKRRILTGLAVPTNIGRPPKAVLADINAAAHVLQVQHAEVFHERVRPVLEEAGIRIVGVDDLPEAERNRLAECSRTRSSRC